MPRDGPAARETELAPQITRNAMKALKKNEPIPISDSSEGERER
jgi:hypothetical protein